MKTLRLELADVSLYPLGEGHSLTGEAWARYTREVRTTDGKVVVLAQARKTVPADGVVEWDVLPNDDPSVHLDDQGFGIEVGWDLYLVKAAPPGRGALNPDRVHLTGGKTITVTSTDDDLVDYAAKAPATPADPLVSYLTEGDAATTYPRKSFLGMELPAVLGDYAALQAAADTAAANGTRLVAAGTITTSSTLTLACDCDLTQLTINYTGTGTAVQLGTGASGNAGILFRKDMRLPAAVNANKAATGWAAGRIGVKAVNTYGCTIRVGRVSGFETGYYATALGTGNVYCDVFLTHLDNNKRNLVLGAGAGGWSNSNTYRLGLLAHNSAEGNNVAGVRQILLETAANIVNGNLFIGGSVEGNTAEYHLDCDGLYNRFLDVRWENASGCRVRWGGNAARNVIEYGYNAQAIVETHVAGSTLNRVYTTGTSRITGSTTKAINVYENTSSSAAGVDAIMDPGASVASADPATAYRVFRTADSTKMKRATDATDRMILDHVNGRLYLGDGGTTAPSTYLQFDSTGLWKLIGASLYPGTDGTHDLGINATRWRHIRARSTVITGTGTTANRPAAATGAGAMFFDTTLNKPIWSDGTNWRDATGAVV